MNPVQLGQTKYNMAAVFSGICASDLNSLVTLPGYG
jgi:hypothetical protein